MGQYTTIQINNNLKEKLNKLKEETGRNRYDEVIEDILNGGRVIDDVLIIQREQTAFILKYWDSSQTIRKDVTYQDLKKSKVGDKFIAHNLNIIPKDDCFNSSAQMICKFNNNNDILLLMKEESIKNGEYNIVEHVLHVKTY